MTSFGPCEPWPARFNCDVSTASPAVTGQAVQVATEILWALSGRQFGLCTVTLRPCRRDCYDAPWPYEWYSPWPGGWSWPQPALIGGLWFNLVCGGCGDTCSCSRVSEALLPAPVHDVVQVRVDGQVLPSSAYRVDDNRRLVRLDGAEWPRCNDLTKDASQPGTWDVTARFGQPVPVAGQWAVGELACQLFLALQGLDCRLPRTVTQVVRQGVTIELPDPHELFKDGLTGLYLVDVFLQAVNPHKLARRAGVYSVDAALARRAGT